jgi:hypothetical protein
LIRQAVESTPELEDFSPDARNTLRVALTVNTPEERLVRILSTPEEQREAWIAEMGWESAEAIGRRIAIATWVLVAATVMLFFATVALVVVTADT